MSYGVLEAIGGNIESGARDVGEFFRNLGKTKSESEKKTTSTKTRTAEGGSFVNVITGMIGSKVDAVIINPTSGNTDASEDADEEADDDSSDETVDASDVSEDFDVEEILLQQLSTISEDTTIGELVAMFRPALPMILSSMGETDQDKVKKIMNFLENPADAINAFSAIEVNPVQIGDDRIIATTRELYKADSFVLDELVGGGIKIQKLVLETYKDGHTLVVVTFEKPDGKTMVERLKNIGQVVFIDDKEEYLASQQGLNFDEEDEEVSYEETPEGLQKFIADNEGMVKYFVSCLADSDDFEDYAKEIIKKRKKRNSNSQA